MLYIKVHFLKIKVVKDCFKQNKNLTIYKNGKFENAGAKSNNYKLIN